ncbi:MAG: C40 family peptidase [Lachnospiraceae bacterium]|nr:C40 family peptidase [Lachnospiraceae bacterium]
MKKQVCALLSVGLALSLATNVMASKTTSQIEKEQAESKKKLESVEEKADAIQEEKENAQLAVNSSRQKLVEVWANVDIIEDEIKDKTDAIAEAEKAYDDAAVKESAQYDAIKKRIRYMYENGGTDSSYFEIFLKATDFADFINKAGYAEQLYEYDQRLLNKYRQTKETTKATKDRLQNELDEMSEIKETYEEQSGELKKTIEEQKAVVDDFDSELATVKSEAAKYKKEIQSQNEEIRKIAAEEEAKRKAKEEAKRKAEEKATKKAAEEAKKAADAEKKAADEAKKAEDAAKKAEDEAKKAAEDAKRSEDEEERKAAEEEKKAAEKEYDSEQEDDEDDDSSKKSSKNDSKSSGSSGSSSSGGSATGSAIASYATQFIGNPYVSGGTSLTNGADCSGFTMSVYAHFGISIPRNSGAQAAIGTAVSFSDARPGDLVCYPGHVGIYIGNGSIVHASTEATGIKVSPATYRTISTIRRVV